MTPNKRFFLLIGIMSVISALVIHFSPQEILGAPQVFISTPATTSPQANFGFTVGTTTNLSAFGSTTLAVYGSTTIQTRINTLHALRIINAASTTVLQVDTVNSSTTFLGNINTLSTSATSSIQYGLNVAMSGGCLAINGTCVSTVANAPSDATYIVTSLNGTLSAERRLQGTANQITLTDGGANGDLTLSFPNPTIFTQASSTRLSVIDTAYFGSTATSTFNSAGALTLATPLTVANGGTGATTLTLDNVLIGNGTSAIKASSSLQDYIIANDITLTNITQITNRAISDTTGTLLVGRGGTGLTTLTAAGRLVYSTDATTLATLTAGASSTVLTIDGTTPSWTAQPNFTTLRIDNLLLIPASASCPTSQNSLCLDTTTNQIQFATSTAWNAVIPAYKNLGFTYATSSAWTGTTTIFLGPASEAQTFIQVKCETDTGTLNVNLNDGTNLSNMWNASTTIGTVTLGTNNTFTSAKTRRVDVGTPATSPKKIACTFRYSINAD